MLSRAPFVSVVLFFAAGIGVGDALRGFLSVPAALFPLLLVLLGAACLICYFRKPQSHFTTVFALWILLLGAGLKTRIETVKDEQLSRLQSLKYTSFLAQVRTLPEKRARSVRFEVEASQFRTGNEWIGMECRALVYLPDSLNAYPDPGDCILIRGQLNPLSPPANPEQFDYARYLRDKGILVSTFVREDAFRVVSRQETMTPAFWPERVSQWADDQLHAALTDSAGYGLVKAMLLGRRDDLGTGQVGDYVISGAVHILSVSGMHIAVIFLVMSATLGWMRRWEVGKWLYVCLMISLLGFYSLVTGMPPSVQRAGLMCVIMLLAEVTGRKQHSINTLAFSALVILLFDPCALYDVGFQLSYLAMAGIFMFYQPIYRSLSPSNTVARFLWQVTALAFSAQLATFPLSLFYFHQFPTYFWLVNPLIVTFTNILLPAALVLLLAGALSWPWLVWIAARVVTFSAWLTDWSASLPRALPGYLLENLHLNRLEVILFYVLLLLGWYTIHARSFRAFKLTAALVVVFVTCGVTASIFNYGKEECVTFNTPGHHVMGFKSGNELFLVSDRSFLTDDKAFDFNVKNYAIHREIRRIVRVSAH